MIIRGQPHCNRCKQHLVKLTEDEAEDDFEAHGWENWKTAHKHYCFECTEKILDDLNYPPCSECETHPCERNPDYCWAEGRYPLHLFPYETYYAERKHQWLEDAIQYDHQQQLPRWLHV